LIEGLEARTVPSTANIGGDWQGTLTQPSFATTYGYTMDLVQTQGSVQGTSEITEDSGQYYGVMSLTGTVSGSTFTFQENAITQQAPPPGFVWLLKSGTLSVSTATNPSTMTGTWESGGASGDIDLTQVPSASTTKAATNVSATYSTSAQSVALSANVTSTAGTVNEGTETFTILNGTKTIGTPVTVNVAAGAASTSYALPAGTAAGTYTIQAVYNGTTHFQGSSDKSQTLTVNPAPTTSVAGSAMPTYYSDSTETVMLSANVTSTAGTVNAGTVTFTIESGGTTIGMPVSFSVVAGIASGSYTLPAGTAANTYTIQAVYNGTTNLQGSSDKSQTLTVNPAPTTSVAGSAMPTYYSDSTETVMLSANVTSTAGTVNAGTVTFTIESGGTTIGMPVSFSVVAGIASGSYALPAGTAVGNYTIQASYGGTSNFASSGDNSPLTVNPAPTASVAGSAMAAYSNSTEPVVLSANVTSTAGTVNVGMVTFTIESGGTTIGMPVSFSVVAGIASGSYTLPGGTAPGTYTIQSAFSGASNFAPSNDALLDGLTVNRVPVGSVVTPPSESLTAIVGQTVALSASVTAATGTINQGSETFALLSGSTVIGTPVTVPVTNGTASADYTLPVGTPPGTYTVRAVYSGTPELASFTDTSQSLMLSASATLMSIAVGPLNPTLTSGPTEQFTATGTYSDGTTKDLTADVTWSSGSPGVASISNAGGSQGLASAASAGTSTITAALGGTTVSTTLTVSVPQVTGVLAVTNSKKGLSSITIGFNEELTAASATNPVLYHVFSGVKKRGKTVYTKGVKIGSIHFDGSHSVTLTLAKPFKGTVEVMVQGSVGAANGASGNVQFTMVLK
jgi:hypothetical protein